MEGGTAPERKVMVVAEPTRESAAALQYTLSHVVVENDQLILLHVENPNTWRNTFSFLRKPNPPSAASGTALSEGGGGGDSDFLEEMKKACKLAQPNLHVQIERVEMDGKDKAATIILRSGIISVDLLIIGQRRSISAAILG